MLKNLPGTKKKPYVSSDWHFGNKCEPVETKPGKSLVKPPGKKKRKKIETPVACPLCPMYVFSLSRHKRLIHGITQPPRNPKKIKVHCEIGKNGQTRVACSICSKRVLHLPQHECRMHGIIPRDGCSKKVTKPTHDAAKKTRKLVGCPMCPKYVLHLGKHKKRVHGVSRQDGPSLNNFPQKSIPRTPLRKRLVNSCPICGSKTSWLAKHLKRKHTLTEEEVTIWKKIAKEQGLAKRKEMEKSQCVSEVGVSKLESCIGQRKKDITEREVKQDLKSEHQDYRKKLADDVMIDQDEMTRQNSVLAGLDDFIEFMASQNNVIAGEDDVIDVQGDKIGGQDDVLTRQDDVLAGQDDVIVLSGPDDDMTQQDNVLAGADDVMTRQDNVLAGPDDVMTRQDNFLAGPDDVMTLQDNVLSGADDVMTQQKDVWPWQDDVRTCQDEDGERQDSTVRICQDCKMVHDENGQTSINTSEEGPSEYQLKSSYTAILHEKELHLVEFSHWLTTEPAFECSIEEASQHALNVEAVLYAINPRYVLQIDLPSVHTDAKKCFVDRRHDKDPSSTRNYLVSLCQFVEYMASLGAHYLSENNRLAIASYLYQLIRELEAMDSCEHECHTC